jgi:putative membrane protein
MKMYGRIATAVAAVATFTFLGLPLAAQNQPINHATQEFMNKAAQGGMAEVELGKLAAQKASNSDVKQFGQRMVDDHTKINDQLKQIATKDNVTLPTTLDAKDQAEKDRLEKLSGESFDKAYMEAMVKDHKTDLAGFQREADRGTSPDVKQFAANTLPTLHEHFNLAEDDLGKVKSQGSAARQQ